MRHGGYGIDCGGNQGCGTELSGIHDPVAMYFRNDYMQKYEECPDNVIDLYHRRNCNEGINSYLKDHLELEIHLNGKGMKNIDLHVTDCHVGSSFHEIPERDKRKSFLHCISYIGGEKIPTVSRGSW
jgi:hypothetical protein